MKKTVLIFAAIAVLGIVVLMRFHSAGDARDPLKPQPRQNSKDYQNFITLSSRNFGDQQQALKNIDANWTPGNAVMLLETTRLIREESLRTQAFDLLEAKTGQAFGDDRNRWFEWIWNREYSPAAEYVKFKSDLYASVDPSFEEYFRETENALIRLDEVRWGSVARDGIPPLDQPKYVSVSDASYLDDADVVFGVVLRREDGHDRREDDQIKNGEVKCFPKRILAWHEMFKDTVGGHSVCGVY